MSFWRLNYHLVWSTKNRSPLLTKEVESILFPFILKKASEFGAFVYAINAVKDHIHLVVSIPPSVSISQFVKGLKGASSRKINSLRLIEGPFAWQRGYGALSLGERQKSTAINYVNNQKSHHAEHSTKYWLEYIAQENEGPSDQRLMNDNSSQIIKEQSGKFGIDQDLPF